MQASKTEAKIDSNIGKNRQHADGNIYTFLIRFHGEIFPLFIKIKVGEKHFFRLTLNMMVGWRAVKCGPY